MVAQGEDAGQFWSGLRDIVPLGIGVAIYGLAFGMLAAEVHYNLAQIASMGGIVFAGGSQIVATQQLALGARAFVAVLAGLALNLRLLLITASIRDVYAGRPLWQILLGAHLTTDESWALLLSARAQGRQVGYWYLVGGGIGIMVSWCLSTTGGFIFSNFIADPKGIGVDFAFTAAFIAIARSLWRGRNDVWPWAATLIVVVAAVRGAAIAPSWALVLGGVSGAVVAGLRRHV